MKLSSKILISTLSIGLGVSLGVGLLQKKNNHVALQTKADIPAAVGYTTYFTDDLGFATRDPNDNRIVEGDADGGMQTKGNVLDTKAELRLHLKRTISHYWIGVGGYAVYISNDSEVRFLHLTYNADGQYGRGIELGGLTMKTADGKTALTSKYDGGTLFKEYTNLILRFDLSDLTAVKASFIVDYQGVSYYPFSGSTMIDELTYTHQASGFSASDTYRAMAGASSNDVGIAIFKTTHEKNMEPIISYVTPSSANPTFSYDYIGDAYFKFDLSEPLYNGHNYLNDHLNDFKDENNKVINLGDGILVDGKSMRYWINFTDPDLNYANASKGVHQFPIYEGIQYNPVALRIEDTMIRFLINTAFIPMDSVTITFKADLVYGYHKADGESYGTTYRLVNDLTYRATLKSSDLGAVYKNVIMEKIPNETVGEYQITDNTREADATNAGGFTYRTYTITTNIPRPSSISEAYPHDHYRYMFDNILINGKSLTFYNVWGRANNKDYTDDTYTTYTPEYETEHPTSGKNYNMVTYARLRTSDYYKITVKFSEQLVTDFSLGTVTISIRDGSAWMTDTGVVRVNVSLAEKYELDAFVDYSLHMVDIPTSDVSGTGACLGNSGYYINAKREYNALSAHDKTLFREEAEYADARARYEEWARINNDAAPYDGNNAIVTPIRNVLAISFLQDKEMTKDIIVIISAVVAGLAAIGLVFFYLRKKSN